MVSGTYWQAERIALSTVVHVRIGYVGSTHYDTYIPADYLPDAVSTLTAIRAAPDSEGVYYRELQGPPLDVLVKGEQFQGQKFGQNPHDDVWFGYRNGVGPELRFYREYLDDLIATLNMLGGSSGGYGHGPYGHGFYGH